jgi:hypothetical protein
VERVVPNALSGMSTNGWENALHLDDPSRGGAA